jgi:hypothetical protein
MEGVDIAVEPLKLRGFPVEWSLARGGIAAGIRNLES